MPLFIRHKHCFNYARRIKINSKKTTPKTLFVLYLLDNVWPGYYLHYYRFYQLLEETGIKQISNLPTIYQLNFSSVIFILVIRKKNEKF